MRWRWRKKKCAQSKPEINDRADTFLKNIDAFRSREAAFQFAFKNGNEDVVELMLSTHLTLHESITEQDVRDAFLKHHERMANLVRDAKRKGERRTADGGCNE